MSQSGPNPGSVTLRRACLCGLVILLAGGHGCVVSGVVEGDALETVENVEIERYLGLWYEIANYPPLFQLGCTNTTAEYSLNDDGTLRVVNSCRRWSLDNAAETRVGRARVVDEQTNAKLKVSFGPFEGDYWIIDLDQDHYQWAVVGEPTRRFLWILYREPHMPPDLYDTITARLPEKGYDPDALVMTRQPKSGDVESDR